MRNANDALNRAFGEIMRSVHRQELEADKRRALADPVKHRLTRTIEGSTSYSYIDAGRNGRGSTVRFCYSHNRNVAGYFLIWRETRMNKKTRRDQWDSTTSKQGAIRTARDMADRHKAAQAARAAKKTTGAPRDPE